MRGRAQVEGIEALRSAPACPSHAAPRPVDHEFRVEGMDVKVRVVMQSMGACVELLGCDDCAASAARAVLEAVGADVEQCGQDVGAVPPPACTPVPISEDRYRWERVARRLAAPLATDVFVGERTIEEVLNVVRHCSSGPGHNEDDEEAILVAAEGAVPRPGG